jgi:hypothetical protein
MPRQMIAGDTFGRERAIEISRGDQIRNLPAVSHSSDLTADKMDFVLKQECHSTNTMVAPMMLRVFGQVALLI